MLGLCIQSFTYSRTHTTWTKLCLLEQESLFVCLSLWYLLLIFQNGCCCMYCHPHIGIAISSSDHSWTSSRNICIPLPSSKKRCNVVQANEDAGTQKAEFGLKECSHTLGITKELPLPLDCHNPHPHFSFLCGTEQSKTIWRILLNFGYWRNLLIPWPSLLPSCSTLCLCYVLLILSFLKGSQKCLLPTTGEVSQGRFSLYPSGINSIFMVNNSLQSLNWKTLSLFNLTYLCQYKYFLGISTTSLCFNGMIQDSGGDRRTPFWQLEVTFYRKNHICFCITKKSQCSVALSPHFNLMDILF